MRANGIPSGNQPILDMITSGEVSSCGDRAGCLRVRASRCGPRLAWIPGHLMYTFVYISIRSRISIRTRPMIHCQIDRFETWCHVALDLLRQDVGPQSVRWEQVAPRSALFRFGCGGRPHQSAPTPSMAPKPRFGWRTARHLAIAQAALCPGGKGRLPSRPGQMGSILSAAVADDARRERTCSRTVRTPTCGDCRACGARLRWPPGKCKTKFRSIGGCRGLAITRWPGTRPQHAVLQLVAPYFVRNFLIDPWALLTPDESVEWDGRRAAVRAWCAAEGPVRARAIGRAVARVSAAQLSARPADARSAGRLTTSSRLPSRKVRSAGHRGRRASGMARFVRSSRFWSRPERRGNRSRAGPS